MLNRSGDSGHPCLIPDFREMVSVFLKYDVGYRFVIYSLYTVEVHSFYSYFAQNFDHEMLLNLTEGVFLIC
jgi:hypothetical protein